MRRLALLAFALAAACSDALEQSTTTGQVIAVASADGAALSLISAADLSTSDVALSGSLGANPRIASRGSILLITSASSGVLTTVDLGQRPYHASPGPSPFASVTDAVIEDDSIAWVVSGTGLARVNYRTGTTRTLTVGSVNTGVVTTAGRVFVLCGNRTGTPLPPSYIRVVNPTTLSVEDSIPLSGTGATDLTVGDDSLIYVVDAGLPSDSAGKLSIVDPVARTEIVIVNGLGAGAGAPVFHPSGRLLVASAFHGILEVNTLTRTLSRPPGHAITDGGQAVTGLAIDEARRVYAADPDACHVALLRVPPDYGEMRSFTVPGCPYSAAPAVVP